MSDITILIMALVFWVGFYVGAKTFYTKPVEPQDKIWRIIQ